MSISPWFAAPIDLFHTGSVGLRAYKSPVEYIADDVSVAIQRE
jgi:hypothetical protein